MSLTIKQMLTRQGGGGGGSVGGGGGVIILSKSQFLIYISLGVMHI